jgi:hypothetical protein
MTRLSEPVVSTEAFLVASSYRRRASGMKYANHTTTTNAMIKPLLEPTMETVGGQRGVVRHADRVSPENLCGGRD